MTPLLVPLLLTAAGGVALVVANDARVALLGLAAQWLGIIWASAELTSPASRTLLGLSRGAAVEGVTAAVSLAILWLTLRGLNYPRSSPGPQGISDYFLPVAAVLLGGIAGIGLSSIFPLTNVPQADLVFYWAALTGLLVLVLDGSHSPIKLTAGLLALLNAVVLVVLVTGARPPSAALLGMLGIVQIILAAVLSFGWALLRLAFGEVSLEPLFDARDLSASTELVVVPAAGEAEPVNMGDLDGGPEPVTEAAPEPAAPEPPEEQREQSDSPAPARKEAPPAQPGRSHRRQGRQSRRDHHPAEGQATK